LYATQHAAVLIIFPLLATEYHHSSDAAYWRRGGREEGTPSNLVLARKLLKSVVSVRPSVEPPDLRPRWKEKWEAKREGGGVKRKKKAGETKMAKVYKKGIWGEVGKEEA